MARLKKSRTMRGKLGKTGSKEMMKEQNKARKSSSLRKFAAKKAKTRKEQAHRKLERLGLLPEQEQEAAPVRPRRFVFEAPKKETEENKQPVQSTSTTKQSSESDELTMDDLLSAFTEQQ
ncbi:hypothetical protein [Marinomonas epiphytica]